MQGLSSRDTLCQSVRMAQTTKKSTSSSKLSTGKSDSRARNVAPEHRWPPAIAILLVVASYFVPSVLPQLERWILAGVVILLLIPLVILNPARLTRQTRWSRFVETLLGSVILLGNQIGLVQVIVLLLHKSNQGDALLLAALQVFLTNVIAFALIFWTLDRGGPVNRVNAPRKELQLADFRFPQDEDHDTVEEVKAGSSIIMDWVPNFIDYLYFSLANSMAFSATDTMPLTHRAKGLMSLESFAGFVLLALVIARAVSLIGS
jgi:uncharacterized membrane protein